MRTRLDSRFLAQLASVLLLLPVLAIASISADKELEYPEYRPSERDITLSRSEYANHLYGFWLGQCIANWTGLRTELHREEAPFYTDANWGGKSDKGRKINFVLKGENSVWMADDDTDIEYIYQHALDKTNTSVLSPEAISEAWVRHIRVLEDGEPYKLWVSNKTAWSLMSEKGILPPDTSDPASNPNWDMIDAQLTTEIFGLFAPHRPDVALDIAHLPIRTTAYQEAQWISEFYVIMHSLALSAGANQGMHERTVWLAEQARKRLPAGSYSAAMYDFVKADYEANPDKDDWERTRDAVYQRYQLEPGDGYQYKKAVDAGINFAAGMISWFYGEGDFKRTIRIGTLSGWDSDNPTATWGGLLGFMLGGDGVQKQFSKRLSGLYQISATRDNFPDYTPAQDGEDSFQLMAERGVRIIDRVVIEEMGGGIDLNKDLWYIPNKDLEFGELEYFTVE